MRVLSLSMVGALALSTLAVSVQAQSIVLPSTSRDATMLQSGENAFGSLMADQVTRRAQRAQLARKAARLINAGDCDKAASLVRARNDTAMAKRVDEVCAAPVKG